MPATAQTLRRWKTLIAAHDASGESLADFASRAGVNPRTLGWWRWRLGTARTTAMTATRDVTTGSPVFAEVVVTSGGSVLVALDRLPARLVVDRDTDLSLVRELLEALA